MLLFLTCPYICIYKPLVTPKREGDAVRRVVEPASPAVSVSWMITDSRSEPRIEPEVDDAGSRDFRIRELGCFMI